MLYFLFLKYIVLSPSLFLKGALALSLLDDEIPGFDSKILLKIKLLSQEEPLSLQHVFLTSWIVLHF